MHSTDSMAPWQIAPVTPANRIAATALVVLALDFAFLWLANPRATTALAFGTVFVAIRLMRGFRWARIAASVAFAITELAAAAALVRAAHPHSTQMSVGPAVAAAVAATGLASVLTGWLRDRRPRVIELTRSTETRIPDGVQVKS